MLKNICKRAALLLLSVAILPQLAACVNQHPREVGTTITVQPSNSVQAEVKPRIVATSYSTMMICDKLKLELVAIPDTREDIPERYKKLPKIGTSMSPDIEAISLIKPTDIIGPDTLAGTIEPKYKAAALPYTFIDMQSVGGMYKSIEMLGEKYECQATAKELIDEYNKSISALKNTIKGKKQPRVLVLMGLPGAYTECTSNSYVGSLIDLAGAKNVAQVDTEENFVSWNTEKLLTLDPDVILLTAHGLPDKAGAMFAKEFKNNDIWSHFRAVKEKKVYQLDYKLFGMSCSFEWNKALNTLQKILYEGNYAPYEIQEGEIEDKP